MHAAEMEESPNVKELMKIINISEVCSNYDEVVSGPAGQPPSLPRSSSWLQQPSRHFSFSSVPKGHQQ